MGIIKIFYNPDKSPSADCTAAVFARIMKIFDSPDKSLYDLMNDARKGEIRLPGFQRGWIWDDEHIKGILANISLAYPIGTIMMLQAGSDDIRFARSRSVLLAPAGRRCPGKR